jgi:cytochrome c oxidase assembly protein subunit 15
MGVTMPGTSVVRRLAVTSLALQMTLVVTGSAVRLSGSGLGCPSWPRCTASSLTNTSALGGHGVIEFGNRVFGVLLEVAAVLLVLAARRWAPRHTRLALVQPLFVPVQAVIGGLLVLSGLNPYVLILHFLASFPLLFAAALLVRRLRDEQTARPAVDPLVRKLGGAMVAAAGLVLVLGSLVTGTGPHAGDRDVTRLPFDPREITQLHADGVFLLVGLSLATLLVAWRGPLRGWAATVVALLAGQAALGYVQYFHGVPALLAGMHVGGATLVFTAATWLFLLAAPAAPSDAPPPRTAPPTPARAAGTTTAR